MHKKKILKAGKDLDKASKALIMLHGRGGSAEDILSLAAHLDVKDFALLAPQATNDSWYPNSFLAPPSQNEPWLSSALQLIAEIVADLHVQNIPNEEIYFAGFSQGACLTLEFITRNARKWGGAAVFTGGLIGDKIYTEHYKGDFENTPIFLGTSDPDPHVPITRVHATTDVLIRMHASVTTQIYGNMGHTISQDEIEKANTLVFGIR